MSNVYVVLQEEQVRVAVGKPGAHPVLEKMYTAPVYRSDMEGWAEALRSLWAAHKLPTSGLTLVLPGNAVTVKTITVPKMPEKKLDELVHQQMQSRSEQEVAADFQDMGVDENGRRQLYCVSCPQATIASYLEMMERLKLRVSRITEPLSGYLKVLDVMAPLKQQTCVWLSFEGGSMLSILVENGQYRYSSRSRIFSEPGTIDFGTEISRSISGMLQFHASQRSTHPITHVYYSCCPEDTFEVCLPNIRNLGLIAGPLPESDAVHMGSRSLRMCDCVPCVGAMFG